MIQQYASYSRLNPAYLAKRHGGAFLLIFALGLAGGLLAQAILMPRTYESSYRRAFAITPPTASVDFDWTAKQKEWAGLIAGNDTRKLLLANLRAATKNLVVMTADDSNWSADQLRTELLSFRSPRTFSTALGRGRIRRDLGPTVEIARHDLAGNIDFQSLARIVADLDPRPDITGWDFSTTTRDMDSLPLTEQVIINPGPDDPFFKVFYRLHALLNNGVAASSPAEAWLTAVAEVSARLVRESDFQGGGGFGPIATRELLEELAVIPVLVANSLFRAAGSVFDDNDAGRTESALWHERLQEGAALRIEHDGAARGSLDILLRSQLYIFAFPFDSPQTRITPLTLRTLFAFIEAWEKQTKQPVVFEEKIEEIVPVEPIPPPVQEVIEPVVDVAALEKEKTAELEEARQKRIAELEARLRAVRIDRDAASLRLDEARQTIRDLTLEAMAARDRADRLYERLEAFEATVEVVEIPEPDPQYTILWAEREALLLYIAELLQYCTDEHPFVVQARRELVALEGRIALLPQPVPDKSIEERKIRLANMRGEWNAVDINAKGLAERRRRLQEEAAKLLDALADAEKKLAEVELALEAERAKANPQSTITDAINRNVDVLAQSIAGLNVAPAQLPSPPLPALPEQTPAPAAPQAHATYHPLFAQVSFSSLPQLMPLQRLPVSAIYIYYGAAAGLCLALLWLLVRELLTSKLTNAYVARRLLSLPLLAVLPAYDMKSLQAAAKAEGGSVAGQGKRVAFVPNPIDIHEPAALGKRKVVRLERRKKNILVWLAALLVIVLAVAAHQVVSRGWLTPDMPFAPEVWRESPVPEQPSAQEQT